MKLIMRIDDVGYSHIHNLGSFDAIDRGIATSADVMMDCPGTVEALEFLRDRPWISVGWHAHFWGTPILPPEQVPSLIEEDRGRIRFRRDLIGAKDVVYEEIYAEVKAEIDRCVHILGRAPETGGSHIDTPLGRAMNAVSQEYGMKSGYETAAKFDPPNDFFPHFDDVKELETSRYDGPPVYLPNPESFMKLLWTDSLKEIMQYDPKRYFLEDPSRMLDYEDDDIVMFALHPGNVDYFVEFLGDRGIAANNYLLCRPIDTECLCSDEVKAWVRDHNVTLINFRDALYGTNDYQIHLKHIGSELYKGL